MTDTGQQRLWLNFRALKGSLARKLMLSIVLLSSILAFLITAIQLYVDYRHDINSVSKKLTNIESGYSQSITESVWVLNDAQISKQLKGIVAIPEICYVAIKIDGQIRWEEYKYGIDQSPPQHQQEQRFQLVKNYKASDRLIGEVILKSSLDEIYSNLYDRIALILFTNTLKTFIVSMFVFFFFYYFITRHLYQLSDYAKEVKLGGDIEPLSFDRPTKSEPNKDELDHLSDAINIMQENLNNSYNYISHTNEKLRQELALNTKINIELSQSHKLIKKKERELDSIINNLVEGVIILDSELHIIRANKACQKIFSYNKQEICALSLQQIVPSIRSGNEEQALDKGAGSVVIESFQTKFYGRNRDGKQFPLRLSLVKLPSEGERLYICTLLDITVELHKEEQLQRSSKLEALGKLSGGIAHDYNNILGVVLGYLELLEKPLKGNPKLSNYLDAIKRASERGAKLTGKLLSFSKHRTSDASAVNLNVLLHDEQQILEKMLTARIKLIFDLEQTLWLTWIDGNDFEDAILNMSINALHAIEGVGEVVIQTRNLDISAQPAEELGIKVGDYICLSIRDNGCGIEMETQDRIFDPFFTTKGKRGNGLGLSQVYGFVERSGGLIQVTSAKNQGTEFTIYFPRYTGTINDELSSNSDQDEAGRGHETILIVDDEAALLDLTYQVLTNKGYRVLCAGNGQEALALLAKEPIDLVFSDVIMPEMDGYQLASTIQRQYPHIKIQLTSGFSSRQHLDESCRLLYENALQKPYHSHQLLKCIRALLEHKDSDK